MSTSPRVLVVGGGIIGTACAHYLERAGIAVTIIEQGKFGSGCSHGNCGYVCPSHVLPLAGPGACWQTLRTMFRRNSPLVVRPRLDPALWNWFYRFARRCHRGKMLAAGHAIQALLQSSRTLYDELFATDRLAAEWQTRGLLYVLRSAARMRHAGEVNNLLRDEFGLNSRKVEGDELLTLEPALRPGLAGGWHYTCDAHLRPDLLLRTWRELLVSRGVEIHENRPLEGIKTKGRAATGARTLEGPIDADAVLIATGAWTPFWRDELRCKLPIQPGKGYSATYPRQTAGPTMPVIFEEDRVAVTPLESGLRLGSTMEFAGYDRSLNRQRLGLLSAAARLYLREPPSEPATEEWWGWRPMTPDGLPYLGRCPAWDNVFVAAGHNMLGLSMAPASGKLMAELITGQPTHIDAQPYVLDRTC